MNFIMRWLQLAICPSVNVVLIEEPEPKPDVGVIEIPRTSLIHSFIHDVGAELLYGWLDKKYYHASLTDWKEALRYIYLVEDANDYISQTYDCEDFAIWLKAMVSKHFQLNTFGIVIGDTPRGKHSFNIFYAENGWYLWEPQTDDGKPFRIGEKGYIPTHILI